MQRRLLLLLPLHLPAEFVQRLDTAMGREYITSYRRLPFSRLALSKASRIATSSVDTPTSSANTSVFVMVFANVEDVATRR